MKFAVVLLLPLFYFSSSEACAACPARHLQQHFCDSQFVMILTVTEVQRESDISGKKKITADIVRNMKRGPGSGEIEFYTPGSICGSSLYPEKTYVVTGTKEKTEEGRKYWLHGSCDFAEEWDDLTPHQQNGFKRDYKRGCDQECKIPAMMFPSDMMVGKFESEGYGFKNDYPDASTFWTPTECYYNPQKTAQFENAKGSKVKDCEDYFGVCERNLTTWKCQWQTTTDYKTCFKYRDDFVIAESSQFAITHESQCDVYTNKRKRRNCRLRWRRLQREHGGGTVELAV